MLFSKKKRSLHEISFKFFRFREKIIEFSKKNCEKIMVFSKKKKVFTWNQSTVVHLKSDAIDQLRRRD